MMIIFVWFIGIQILGPDEQFFDQSGHSIIYNGTFTWKKSDGTKQNISVPGRFDGIIFLIIFAVYVLMMVFQAMRARNNQEVVQLETMENEELMIMSYPKSLLCIVGGAAAIAFGGDLTVDAASRIAIDFGMSQNLVGLTIVSIGTSLPELVTSIVAARKNEVDMAVGNAIGSNIFNILMVLGIASAISPLQLIGENVIDIIVLVVFSVVVWIFGATKKKISRTEGIAMICMYLCYSVYIIMR